MPHLGELKLCFYLAKEENGTSKKRIPTSKKTKMRDKKTGRRELAEAICKDNW
jgi:hypothetical protein